VRARRVRSPNLRSNHENSDDNRDSNNNDSTVNTNNPTPSATRPAIDLSGPITVDSVDLKQHRSTLGVRSWTDFYTNSRWVKAQILLEQGSSFIVRPMGTSVTERVGKQSLRFAPLNSRQQWGRYVIQIFIYRTCWIKLESSFLLVHLLQHRWTKTCWGKKKEHNSGDGGVECDGGAGGGGQRCRRDGSRNRRKSFQV